MKQQAIQYVALDVHQATLVVSVRDEQGSVVMRATVATEAKAIVGLVRGLGSLTVACQDVVPIQATDRVDTNLSERSCKESLGRIRDLACPATRW